MAGDGVSLPTTIAQMGTVAKTQAKGQQQTAQQTTAFAEQLDKKDELKVKRVKETQKAEQQKIDPDAEQEKDRRRRRRLKRNQKFLARGEDPQGDENSQDQQEDQEEQVGILIDLRV